MKRVTVLINSRLNLKNSTYRHTICMDPFRLKGRWYIYSCKKSNRETFFWWQKIWSYNTFLDLSYVKWLSSRTCHCWFFILFPIFVFEPRSRFVISISVYLLFYKWFRLWSDILDRSFSHFYSTLTVPIS